MPRKISKYEQNLRDKLKALKNGVSKKKLRKALELGRDTTSEQDRKKK